MSVKNLYPNIEPTLNLSFALTKALDPRVSFARASTARFYDGKTVAKAEENLFQFSQEFDNAYWGKLAVTVTANNAVAPDGTTTAELVVPTTANTAHAVTRSFSSGINTLSVFAKPAGYDYISITDGANGAIGQFTVNLTTGVITQNTASAFITANVTAAGDGWYRISIFRNFAAGVFLTLAPTNTETGSNLFGPAPFAGDGTSGILLWGAQLEQRSAVTAYTPTTDQPITNYVPVLLSAANNVARFDHNPVTGESLGLLIEEQRTNLVTYSEDFGDAAWGKTNTSVTTSNVTVAPGGTATAYVVQENTSNAQHSIDQTGRTISAGATVTLSVYVKNFSGTRWAMLHIYGTSGAGIAHFQPSTGTLGAVAALNSYSGASATSTAVGNGWYRVSLTVTTATDTSIAAAVRYKQTDNGPSVYTGDGFSGIYIWGAQLESASFSTSYIPTVASAVTRSADAASMTGANFSSWYRADEGTLYAENQRPLGSRGSVAFDNGTDSQRIVLANNIDNSNNALVTVNAITQTNNTFGTNTAQFAKFAMAYKFNDISAAQNAGTVNTASTASIPVVNQMRLGIAGGGPGQCFYKKVAFYPRRISNAELQALTT
jgi:hypothetical protein